MANQKRPSKCFYYSNGLCYKNAYSKSDGEPCTLYNKENPCKEFKKIELRIEKEFENEEK